MTRCSTFIYTHMHTQLQQSLSSYMDNFEHIGMNKQLYLVLLIIVVMMIIYTLL